MDRVEPTRRWGWCGVVVLAVAGLIQLLPQLARADEAAEKKGAALMDKYVEATGGKAAYEAVKTRVLKGQQVLPNGDTGKFQSYWAYPDKFRSIVEVPFGTLERGSDGKTVWISFPTGATILQGAQRVAVLRDSPRERFGRWRELYQKAEYVGDEDVDGTPCSKVALTLKPLDPKVRELPINVFLAKDSGLIVKWISEYTAQEEGNDQGNLVVTISVSDYRKVGDLRIAHQMKIDFQQQELNIKVEEITLNATIPADKFALPDNVKEQLQEKKEDAGAKKGP
jgi:outer membrane lipoprotein-sorting protein